MVQANREFKKLIAVRLEVQLILYEYPDSHLHQHYSRILHNSIRSHPTPFPVSCSISIREVNFRYTRQKMVMVRLAAMIFSSFRVQSEPTQAHNKRVSDPRSLQKIDQTYPSSSSVDRLMPTEYHFLFFIVEGRGKKQTIHTSYQPCLIYMDFPSLKDYSKRTRSFRG